MQRVLIRRALISVSDKTGLGELAKALADHGIEMLSTGGTYRFIAELGFPVVEISSYTGFPELMDGRVKTLHPMVHGGILFRRDQPEHVQAADEHGIGPIDMVVVNLYPFESTVAKASVSLEEAIEQIDIGGPAMIRSAAKNHSHVAVITAPSQYADVIGALADGDGSLPTTRLKKWAIAAFERTASYDRAIHAYLSAQQAIQEGEKESFPASLNVSYTLEAKLRYGENPHQKAAFYVDGAYQPASVARARQIHGKELSYNNLLDLDAALAVAREFHRPAAVVIKHNNPCGAAVADSLVDAFNKALAGDPLSAFGSVIGMNHVVDERTALAMTEPDRFVEAVIAPSFSEEAVRVLTTRPTWKSSVRLLEVGGLTSHEEVRRATMTMRPIEGGLLCQSPDLGTSGWDERRVVTQKSPTTMQLRDLEFAWIIVKHVRSNAIVLALDEALIGVGAGQMSRVDSVQIACTKAGPRSGGSVLASDAFFPFRDNVDLAAKSGIAAIIQPGGSKRDQDSIDACDELGMAMLFTGVRHFKH